MVFRNNDVENNHLLSDNIPSHKSRIYVTNMLYLSPIFDDVAPVVVVEPSLADTVRGASEGGTVVGKSIWIVDRTVIIALKVNQNVSSTSIRWVY